MQNFKNSFLELCRIKKQSDLRGTSGTCAVHPMMNCVKRFVTNFCFTWSLFKKSSKVHTMGQMVAGEQLKTSCLRSQKLKAKRCKKRALEERSFEDVMQSRRFITGSQRLDFS
jgi:hypothetical protein